jgi:hypothetical protein
MADDTKSVDPSNRVELSYNDGFIAFWRGQMVFENGRAERIKAEKEAWEFLARCDLAGTMAVSPIAASAYAGIRPTLKTMKATTGLAQTDRRATWIFWGRWEGEELKHVQFSLRNFCCGPSSSRIRQPPLSLRPRSLKRLVDNGRRRIKARNSGTASIGLREPSSGSPRCNRLSSSVKTDRRRRKRSVR